MFRHNCYYLIRRTNFPKYYYYSLYFYVLYFQSFQNQTTTEATNDLNGLKLYLILLRR
uniref:Uncharacterized protein n=1 Tax=virus sp. ctML55 TaxID=2827627 RepID=A0A8S5RI33_9VIRU|nr:MAG TPA: hypothetical protein [virus sp. ctML55]